MRDGYGYGVGSGAGYGFGYADGYGYGGDSYGNGGGDGSGYGDGYGYGDGIGYGDVLLGEIPGGKDVRLVWPGVIAIGCRVLSLPAWRERWRELAEEYEIQISEDEVERLLRLAETTDYTAGEEP